MVTKKIETPKKRKIRSFRKEDLINEALATLSATWEAIYPIVIEIEEILKELKEMQEHFHSCHFHNNGHNEGINNCFRGAAYQFRKIVGCVEYLMTEAHNAFDMDDNGEIFGNDFIFKNDKSITPYFRRINIDPIARNVIPDQINLDSYLELVLDLVFCPDEHKELLYSNDYDFFTQVAKEGKRVPTSELIDSEEPNVSFYTKTGLEVIDLKEIKKKGEYMVEIPQIIETEIIDDLINEFNTGVDQNGDGLVFGKDFILLNAPSQLMSKVPPFMPNIILSWNAFKMADYPSKGLRGKEYYCDLLNQEYVYNIDKDGNGLRYGRDFYISNDIDCLEPVTCDNPISWPDYLDQIKVFIDKSCVNMEEFTVKLAVEYHSQEDLDDNDLIYGIDFLFSDCDEAKNDCLWRIEIDKSFSVQRDISRLTDVRDSYGFSPNMLVDYDQNEFIEYWESLSNIPEVTLSDCENQNAQGLIIQGGQIISYCLPIWKNKFKKYPMFIPILTCSDYIKL